MSKDYLLRLDYNVFGERLMNARIESNTSRRELCAISNISQEHLRKVEIGCERFSLEAFCNFIFITKSSADKILIETLAQTMYNSYLISKYNTNIIPERKNTSKDTSLNKKINNDCMKYFFEILPNYFESLNPLEKKTIKKLIQSCISSLE